ncbi:mandelate racemase/muconate lactonizing enzyme family protein [Microbacterium sp. NPDC089696]|uniref:mandelate racemase/muconate lactonizing enzyme family protein n=1 Tax=Microbacterium sp. NPDC089696 TaxID=3364199 RepID=UPI00382D1CA7
MKITDVAVEAYRLPPSSPWEDATNRVDSLEFVIVTLTTDTGLTGTGLSYSVDIGGSAMKVLIEDYLAALVLGQDPLDFERIWKTLNRQSRRLGLGMNSMCVAAVDIAVWDLIGKIHGLPLYRLLGGSRDSISTYVSEINLAADDTVDALEARIEDYVARGYGAVKIKIGHDDLELDEERVCAAYRHLAPRKLLVDLNQKWTSAEARRNAARIDAMGLGWIEEPLSAHDVAGHVSLRQRLDTPLAIGESLHSRQQFVPYLSANAVDYVQADVAFVGGITEWWKIAHLANGFGKLVAPHFMMELSLQLLCGVDNAFLLEDVVGGSLTSMGLLAEPIEVRNGIATPPSRPGHGLVFDESELAKHVLDRAKVRASFSGGSK